MKSLAFLLSFLFLSKVTCTQKFLRVKHELAAEDAIDPQVQTVITDEGAPPAPPKKHIEPRAAPNGACGAGVGSCIYGYCCSQWGYCGSTAAHCGVGCQAAYGACTGSAAAPVSPPAAPSSPANGACGPGVGKCRSGYCCSQWGYCGTTSTYCGAGCQAGYGDCSPPPKPFPPNDPPTIQPLPHPPIGLPTDPPAPGPTQKPVTNPPITAPPVNPLTIPPNIPPSLKPIGPLTLPPISSPPISSPPISSPPISSPPISSPPVNPLTLPPVNPHTLPPFTPPTAKPTVKPTTKPTVNPTNKPTAAPVVTAPPVTPPPVTPPPVTPPPVTPPPVTPPPVTAPPVTAPPVTPPPVTPPPVTLPPTPPPTFAPVTQPPVTLPPVTAPPVTKPPVTAPPVTEPPVTAPPVTKPPVTAPPVTMPPTDKPSNILLSAYKDIAMGMDWGANTNVLSTMVTGNRMSVVDALALSGTDTVTWAFATGSCNSETWAGVSPQSLIQANIPKFVAAGKKYIISTGGAAGAWTCTSDAGFEAFISRYYTANMVALDFDIEGGRLGQYDINSIVQRVKNIQSAGKFPNLKYSFTLATFGGNANPILGTDGVNVMNAIKAIGISNYYINLMAMDYFDKSSWSCVLGSDGRCDMGKSAIQAATALHNQYSLPYNQIGVTPMIGTNDDTSEVFNAFDDVDELVNFAKNVGLYAIHFWAFDRDKDCPIGPPQNECNSYGQAGMLGFSRKFATALKGPLTPISLPVSSPTSGGGGGSAPTGGGTPPIGACGAGIGKCSPGYCCSQYGYCGTTAAYCGAGCQRNYGNCN